MKFNLKTNPFSCREAYLSVIEQQDDKGGGIWIKTLIRPEWGKGNPKVSNLLLKIIPTLPDGRFCEYEVIAKPTHIDLKIDAGYVRLYFRQYNTIRLEVKNAAVVFEYGNRDNQPNDVKVEDQKTVVQYGKLNQFIDLKLKHGVFEHHQAFKRLVVKSAPNNRIDFSFWVNDLAHPSAYKKFDTVQDVKKDYESFRNNYQYKSRQEELAIYTLWTLEYVKCGYFLDNAIAIAKNDMNLTWGWDHLMMALAMVDSNPKLAWSGLNVFFKLQNASGMLPDAINPVVVVDWYTKPPVYGYFMKKMHQKGFMLTDEQATYVYQVLVKLTNWWIDENTVLPKYIKPFDSGWDNATCFDDGGDVTTPDIVSYLIVQMDYLVDLAKQQDLVDEVTYWQQRRDQLKDNFITTLWDEREFLCIRKDHKFKTTSLIRMIPIILEHLLPQGIMQKLIEELSVEDHFLTKNGYATEAVDSILYDTRKGDPMKPNAYWRGPLWSPPMYMIIEALKYAGKIDLANDVTNRYVDAIESSESFYENYDAIKPTGYDDFGYGWTVAAYILLKKLDEKS